MLPLSYTRRLLVARAMLFVSFRKILCNNTDLSAVGGCGCHLVIRGFPMRRISFATLSSVSFGSLALGIATPSHAAAAAAAAAAVAQDPTPAPCVQIPAGPQHDQCLADA